MDGKLFTIQEQLDCLESHGITFGLVSKREATRFLTDHTYFFKLKSYENNYNRIPATQSDSYRYENLDFAYLQELSLLDTVLKHHVASLCLDIEYGMKIKLNKLLIDNENRNLGDQCISHYFFGRNLSAIVNKHQNPYTDDLVAACNGNYKVWHLWELLDFNAQIGLHHAYYEVTKQKDTMNNWLFITHKLRNAVVHGNCLLTNVSCPSESMRSRRKADWEVSKPALKMCGKKWQSSTHATALQKSLDYLVVNNYAAALLCHLKLVNSPEVIERTCERMNEFIERICLHKDDYFGDKDTVEPRNPAIHSVLNALCELSTGYATNAQEKAERLRQQDQAA
ncbi:Abi family protein [Bifidobacterium aemilianum]|uniref:Abi family protein n=1 Tax=Bifidobacterium aemilianum TaxID=2493120 RepID=UPI001374E5C3|nr:Abi family protein [Bifidobacterium aemilianum]